MPLKGHARNMVSSYARYLGLDSEEMTKQFLSEYHDFENREARAGSSRPLNPRPMSQRPIETNPLPVYRGGKPGETQGVRSMWDKPIPTSELNRGYDSRSSSAQRVADAASRRRTQTSDDRLSRRSSGGVGGIGASVGGNSVGGMGGGMPRQSLPMRILGPVLRSPVALTVVLIVIIVIALVIWVLVANNPEKTNEVVPPINVDVPNNGDDTSGNTEGDNNTAGEGTEDDSKYGPFTLVLEPVAGTTPWTRVIVDGVNVYEDLLSEAKTWPVAESCEIATGQPDNLKVTRNGESVTLDISDGGTGSVTLEVQTRPANPEGQSNPES
jgi:cytoskeletal protein RodZ